MMVVVGDGKFWWMGRLMRLYVVGNVGKCWMGNVGWIDGLSGVGGGLGERLCFARILLMMGWSCVDLNPAL